MLTCFDEPVSELGEDWPLKDSMKQDLPRLFSTFRHPKMKPMFYRGLEKGQSLLKVLLHVAVASFRLRGLWNMSEPSKLL